MLYENFSTNKKIQWWLYWQPFGLTGMLCAHEHVQIPLRSRKLIDWRNVIAFCCILVSDRTPFGYRYRIAGFHFWLSSRNVKLTLLGSRRDTVAHFQEALWGSGFIQPGEVVLLCFRECTENSRPSKNLFEGLFMYIYHNKTSKENPNPLQKCQWMCECNLLARLAARHFKTLSSFLLFQVWRLNNERRTNAWSHLDRASKVWSGMDILPLAIYYRGVSLNVELYEVKFWCSLDFKVNPLVR